MHKHSHRKLILTSLLLLSSLCLSNLSFAQSSVVETSSYAMIEAAKDLLNAYPTDTDKKISEAVEKAIKHIDKSLELELWVDENHLAQKGDKVFDESKDAVKELADKEFIEPFSVVALNAINLLREANYNIAQKAITEVECNSYMNCEKELEKANEEMTKAFTEESKDNYDKAIDLYKKAWKHALMADKKIRFTHAMMQDVKNLLTPYLTHTDKKIREAVEKAIEHIDKSLEPELWVDENHLTEKSDKVFDETKEAVKELTDKNFTEPFSDDALAATDLLLAANYNIAKVAIDEMEVVCGGDPNCVKELQKANEEMNKASDELSQEKYDKTIDHYKKAWKYALNYAYLLPVELNSFTAKLENDIVTLNWQTATEMNNRGFEVERNSGIGWETIGFVLGYGNSTARKYYSFTDSKLLGGNIFMYRLKQLDYNGHFEYSNMVEVEIFLNKFSLNQNYPNPFNPSTTIQYEISSQQYITLKVYNLLGKEVATLVNDVKPAGIYEVTLDAANMPSGVYFYKLHAGSFVETKQMILLR